MEDGTFDDSLIQPEWVALERKLARRKPKRKGKLMKVPSCCASLNLSHNVGVAPEGRSTVRESAWDAEHV